MHRHHLKHNNRSANEAMVGTQAAEAAAGLTTPSHATHRNHNNATTTPTPSKLQQQEAEAEVEVEGAVRAVVGVVEESKLPNHPHNRKPQLSTTKLTTRATLSKTINSLSKRSSLPTHPRGYRIFIETFRTVSTKHPTVSMPSSHRRSL